MENLKELVQIQCPVCKAQTEVSIPNEIIRLKKMGTTQIKISKGICCEHNFIIFVDKKMKIMGTESADIILGQTETKEKVEEIHLSDIVSYYGKEIVSHFLKAFLLDIPIVFIDRKDFSVNIDSLNLLFGSILPVKSKIPFVISALREDEKDEAILKKVVQYDFLQSKITLPWKEDKITRKFEESIINKALSIMESSSQAIVLQEELGILLDKAEYISICKQQNILMMVLVEKGFIKKFGATWEKGEHALLTQISKKIFGIPVDPLGGAN